MINVDVSRGDNFERNKCFIKIGSCSMSFVFVSVLRPVLLCGAECWTMRKKEANLMRRTEMRMLKWILGISLKDKTRNEEIRRCGVVDIAEEVRETRAEMVWSHYEER